jgi:hypothetical protein
MTNQQLSTYFNLNRRYFRSVNLERDLDIPDAVLGYVPTERSIDALHRIVTAFDRDNAHRYWTMTGVYGTGKSAFAHYLACLCAPIDSEVKQNALAIAQRAFEEDNTDLIAIRSSLEKKGLFRAIATAKREPLSWTILEALANGVNSFWVKAKKRRIDSEIPSELCATRQPKVAIEIIDLVKGIRDGSQGEGIPAKTVLSLLKKTIQAIDCHLLIIIDELGKNLEFASMQTESEDLYLLQQIAEMKIEGDNKIHLLGMLHQSFAGYSNGLTTLEQNEWIKIQGRFEDIPFAESPNQMTRLIGQAIDKYNAAPISDLIHRSAQEWFGKLQELLNENEISANLIANTYPLHPLTSLILPSLCVRYAQNDRSLFTFLTSDEPYAFGQFLDSEVATRESIPLLKLDRVYDYFVESVTGLTSRINLQRWIEIQTLIQDAGSQPPEILRILKTIGVMNLVTATGSLRASPELVALALCDRPNDGAELAVWHKQIESLKTKGLITYRRQGNELRIWEGSDFNVDRALQDAIALDRFSLANLLAEARPLKPLVAQRHYTTTGSLRYFDRQYASSSTTPLAEMNCSSESYDGLIIYWLDSSMPQELPAVTQAGKPLVIVKIDRFGILQTRAQEFAALKQIQSAPELLTDGVARKEVRHRLIEAERLLDDTIAQAFDWTDNRNICWAQGERVEISLDRAFQSLLSSLCDRVYSRGLKLDNELINRQELTSQGAAAQRKLIEAAIEFSAFPQLNLEGYGPEVTIYHSVFRATGIHRLSEDKQEQWGFYPPDTTIEAGKGIAEVWQAVEDFCLSAIESQQSLDLLYRELEQPPYGVRASIIPLLIVAVLIYRIDDVSLYKDGVFIPILSPEHFELLVRDPSRYSVKYIEVVGLRAEVFRELEAILRNPNREQSSTTRNATLLSVVKPLFQFEKRLPAYTKRTARMSDRARAVLTSFQDAKEPDVLIFNSLPIACELPPIPLHDSTELELGYDLAKELRNRLVSAIQEIQQTYENLLIECKSLLHSAFGIQTEADKLREDLRVRASYLVGNCIDATLKGFTIAAIETSTKDRDWLEALITIVADKSPTSWNDADLVSFEVRLSDVVRRFQNLEAIQRETVSGAQELSHTVRASRITVTQADGREVNRTVWIEQEQNEKIDRVVEELIGKIEKHEDPNLRQAIVARLAERIFNSSKPRIFDRTA